MVLTQVVRWADNTAELKRNLAQGLDQIEAVKAGAEKMVNAMRGDKLIESAHRMVAAIGMLDQGVKAFAPQEAASRLAFLERAIDKLERTGGKVPTQFREMADALRGVAPQAGILSTAFGRLTAAFTTANFVDRAITGLVSMGTAAFTSASKIVDLSQKTGLSIEAVQRLGHVAQQSGSSIDQYASSVFKLGINLEAGGAAGKKAADALLALGVSSKEIKSLAPEKQFDLMMRGLAAITDIQQRNRLGVDLLGKSYENVAASVDQYVELIGKAQVATERNVRAVSAAKNAWDAFWAGVGAGAVNVVGGVIVELDRLTSAAAKADRFRFADADRIKQIQREDAIAAGTRVPGDINLPRQPPADVSLDFVKRIADARREIGLLTAAQRTQLDAAEKLGIGFDTLADKIGLSADAQMLYASVSRDAAQAAKKNAEEIKKLFEEFSGIEATNKLMQMNAALLQMGRQGLSVAREQINPFVKAIADLLREGGRAPDVLGRWFQAHVTVANSGFEVSTSVQKVTKALQEQFGLMESQVIPTWLKWDLAVKDSLLVGAAAQKKIRELVQSMSLINLKAPPPVFRQHLVDSVRAISREMGDVVLNALTGGGNVGRSLGALAGRELGTSLMRTLGTTLDKEGKEIRGFLSKHLGTIGEMIASFLPGAGALIGFLFGPSWRDKIHAFADEFAGGMEKLREKMRSLGAEGDQLWDRLNGVGRRRKSASDALKAIEDTEAAFERLAERQKAATKHFDQLSSSVERFGGVAPRALHGYIDALLQSAGLTEDMREALEALKGTPSLDALRAAAERYGKTLDDLGQKTAQLDVSDTFDRIFSDFTMLSDAGADTTELYKAMAGQINAALDRARRLGLSVPEFMRPMLEAMLRMGLLTDEFGNQLNDLNGFTFSASIESSMEKIASILERIAVAMEAAALAAQPIIEAPEEIPFGSKRSTQMGGQTVVNIQMEGQTIARAITPWLPDEVLTMRLA